MGKGHLMTRMMLVDKKLKEEAAKVKKEEQRIINAAKKLTEQRQAAIIDIVDDFKTNLMQEIRREIADYEKEIQKLFDKVTTPKRTRKKRTTKADIAKALEQANKTARLLTLVNNTKEVEMSDWITVADRPPRISTDDTLEQFAQLARMEPDLNTPRRRGRPKGTTKRAANRPRRGRPKGTTKKASRR